MTPRLFMSKAERFTDDVRAAASLKANPVWLATPDRDRVAGVGIFVGTAPRFMIPLEDALRIAHEIADAVQTHKENR